MENKIENTELDNTDKKLNISDVMMDEDGIPESFRIKNF